MKVVNKVRFGGNIAEAMVVDPVGTVPGSPIEGQVCYLTSSKCLMLQTDVGFVPILIGAGDIQSGNGFLASGWKSVALAATTGNITISNPGTAVFDGVTLSLGDRLLVKSQTAPEENGVYVFQGSSNPVTRAGDFDTDAKVVGVSYVAVLGGTVNANTLWRMPFAVGDVLGTDPQTWSELTFGGGGSSFEQDIGDGSTTSFTITHSLGTRNVQTLIFDNSTFEVIGTADVANATTNTVTIDFSALSTPTTNQYHVVCKAM